MPVEMVGFSLPALFRCDETHAALSALVWSVTVQPLDEIWATTILTLAIVQSCQSNQTYIFSEAVSSRTSLSGWPCSDDWACCMFIKLNEGGGRGAGVADAEAGVPPSSPEARSWSSKEVADDGAVAGVAEDRVGVLGFRRAIIWAIETGGIGGPDGGGTYCGVGGGIGVA
jgi:hypothetical protein